MISAGGKYLIYNNNHHHHHFQYHYHYHQHHHQIKLSLAIMSLGPLDDKAQIVRFTCYLRSKIMMIGDDRDIS